VLWSGVRFAEYETPQGPPNAELVPRPDQIHGPDGAGGGGTFIDSGWPESMRVMSGSGPFGPIFIGVWQSLQDMMSTRYFPRAGAVASSGFAG
jgi:hypothetical protein